MIAAEVFAGWLRRCDEAWRAGDPAAAARCCAFREWWHRRETPPR